MYPTTIAELEKCQGVSKGKAMRYGKPFVELIAKYVEENNIEKPDDFVMKSVVNKSGNKVHIIQQVDKKIPLETIAKNKDMRLDALLEDMETIAASGTRLNLDYAIDGVVVKVAHIRLWEELGTVGERVYLAMEFVAGATTALCVGIGSVAAYASAPVPTAPAPTTQAPGTTQPSPPRTTSRHRLRNFPFMV